MTMEELLRMAASGANLPASLSAHPGVKDFGRRLAALARTQTLEAAAKVCEGRAADHEESAQYEENADYALRYRVYAKHERRCADEIRRLA